MEGSLLVPDLPCERCLDIVFCCFGYCFYDGLVEGISFLPDISFRLSPHSLAGLFVALRGSREMDILFNEFLRLLVFIKCICRVHGEVTERAFSIVRKT
jgi:hypothetical protein